MVLRSSRDTGRFRDNPRCGRARSPRRCRNAPPAAGPPRRRPAPALSAAASSAAPTPRPRARRIDRQGIEPRQRGAAPEQHQGVAREVALHRIVPATRRRSARHAPAREQMAEAAPGQPPSVAKARFLQAHEGRNVRPRLAGRSVGVSTGATAISEGGAWPLLLDGRRVRSALAGRMRPQQTVVQRAGDHGFLLPLSTCGGASARRLRRQRSGASSR